MFSTSSRARLTHHDLGRFPGQTLFDRVGRAVCKAGCLPRKELFEAWEVARRTRRLVRGGRVVDLCGGHGLLGHLMLLLDDSSPTALVVDQALPKSASRVHEVLTEAWPRLAGRVTFQEAPIETAPLAGTDVVVSSHACGDLTDLILTRAAAARAAVSVLPCCHDMLRTRDGAPLLDAGDPGTLHGWVDRSMAIDILRAHWLEARGYVVRTQTIPEAITPKNRLLIGVPTPSQRLAGRLSYAER
jgi:hypothetical protein